MPVPFTGWTGDASRSLSATYTGQRNAAVQSYGYARAVGRRFGNHDGKRQHRLGRVSFRNEVKLAVLTEA